MKKDVNNVKEFLWKFKTNVDVLFRQTSFRVNGLIWGVIRIKSPKNTLLMFRNSKLR